MIRTAMGWLLIDSEDWPNDDPYWRLLPSLTAKPAKNCGELLGAWRMLLIAIGLDFNRDGSAKIDGLIYEPAKMNQRPSDPFDYFPVILCTVCDSPIDALVALCVRRVEAMDLVAAARWCGEMGCIVTTLHGGRQIAVMPTLDGRWASCNAFLDEVFATPQEATWKLNTLLKRGRTGYVGYVQRTVPSMSANILNPLQKL